MARSFSEILQSVGIGVKSDAQKQRESNPGMNQFGTRSGPEYADIKAQEEINRQAGVNLRRFDGRLKSGEKLRNIGGVTYVVPAPSAAPVEPSTPYTPQSFNPQVEGVQALSPFGMFGTEFTPLEDRAQPETVKDVVTQELKKVREEETAREKSPYGYGLMGARFKTEPRERIDLRTGAKTFDRPGDDAGDSFFKIDQFGEGAPDAAVVAGLNTGEFSQEDEFKYLPRTGKSRRDVTGRSSGMDLLYGLLDIRGKAGPETPEQQARADAAEEVKNELLEKQFIAQELVDAGIIDRRQVSNPASINKVNEIYEARKEDPLANRPEVTYDAFGNIIEPVKRQGLVADLYEAANIIGPVTDVTSAYQQSMVDADKKRAEENKSEGLFTTTQEQGRRIQKKRAEEKELMALGEAFGIEDMDTLPQEPPAIVEKAPVTYDAFGNIIESTRAKIINEPIIAKAVDTIGMNTDEWEAYKQGIADIESSGGKYTVTSGKHWGKYQMNDDARSDAAETMGIDNPSKQEFLENPELQERMFAEYTRRNYLHLMQKSPEFRGMSEKEKYSTLARAQLGAEALRKTLAGLTPDKIDANKTKSSKFKDSVEKRLNSIANDKGGFEGTGEF